MRLHVGGKGVYVLLTKEKVHAKLYQAVPSAYFSCNFPKTFFKRVIRMDQLRIRLRNVICNNCM